MAEGLSAALKARLAQITTTLELRTIRAAIIATAAPIPGNAEHRAVVQGVIDSFGGHGSPANYLARVLPLSGTGFAVFRKLAVYN